MTSQGRTKTGKAETLRPRADSETETAWRDPWEATKATRAQIYTRDAFMADLELVSRRITSEINSDPDEVRKLRAAEREADEGKTRVYRRRGTKSG